jgi:predicted HTH domain antitoxin
VHIVTFFPFFRVNLKSKEGDIYNGKIICLIRKNAGDENMVETKFEKIEVDIPRDIIFVLRRYHRPDELKGKLKLALAILLFQEKVISQGKAAELAELSRVKFIEVLKEHSIPVYEYNEEDYQRDQQAIARYRELVGK